MSDVRAYYDINVTLRKLDDALTRARFTDGRGGMVPPADIIETIAAVGDAYATLRALLATTTTRPMALAREGVSHG